MKKNNKGFTLVELIVVLVILAILAAILVPTLLGWIDKARSEKDYSTAQTVRVAAQAMIDQAYGDGKTTAGTDVANISAMSGTITQADSYGSKVLGTSGLAGVGSEVSAFSFEYSNGIITGGTVTINGHTYTLASGAWSAS